MTTQNFDGKQTTMVLINSVGFPVARQIKLHSIESRVGQYGDKSEIVRYTEKGKRKVVGTLFNHRDAQVAIFAGWHTVTTPNIFEGFDSNVYQAMKDQIGGQPLFELAK